MNDYTIYALASAPGKAGVAVVRVSGPAAGASLALLGGAPVPPPRQAVLRTLRDPVSRETIDRGLVLFFKGPASFTGEDTAEYHLHGGLAVVESFLAALSAQPAHRMAEPGEFTRRAFENGKLDLTAAEAVADLINAETQAQKSQALDQMGGALATFYDGWRARLTKALAYIEADIDFSDEDLPEGVTAQVLPEIKQISAELADHLEDNRRGERLRNGIQIAVIGAPNAGKSSLVNALAQRDVAIVSPEAGTTRDIIEVHLDLGGYPVILADTAGLRPDQLGQDGQARIESEGIRRALARAESADLRLLLFDAHSLPALDPHTQALVNDQSILVLNKCEALKENLPAIQGHSLLPISVQTGVGLPALLEELTRQAAVLVGSREMPSLTRQRHREALQDCRDSLGRALTALMPELMAEDLRLAIRHLGRITGRVDVEDLLDVIFRDFCIGK